LGLPKAKFRIRLNEKDNLALTVWPTKNDPTAEVVVAEISRREEDNWEIVAKIATFRATDGKYVLIEQKEPEKAQAI
jgi:hypothetical protein